MAAKVALAAQQKIENQQGPDPDPVCPAPILQVGGVRT
jgi:hypothetical protein